MFYCLVLCLFIYFKYISCSYLGTNSIDCKGILNEFSAALSDFTNCSVFSAQPIKICENCAESYNNIINNYTELTEIQVNGMACITLYINLDRLQVVNTIFKNAINLWDKANCLDCVKLVNGSLEPTEVKKQFNTKYDIFYKCTLIYNGTNTTDLCTNCIEEYSDLNEFYFNTGDTKNGIDGVCMDIVDLMNKTQSNWSKNCCHYRQKNEIIYILTTVFMCLLPLSFYVLVKLFVDIKRPTLVPHNRYADSMNNQSTSFS